MEKVLKDTSTAKEHQEDVTQSTLIFNENLYKRAKWTVDVPSSGYASLVPMFVYDTEEVDEDELETIPTIHQVEAFVSKIFFISCAEDYSILVNLFPKFDP